MNFRALVAAAAVAPLVLASCGEDPNPRVRVAGGNPTVGEHLIEEHGCGSCHTIPGIDGADALVGPPLIHWSQRGYIAGQLRNTPDNLVRWLRDPEAVAPGTAMPDVGLSPDEARHVAAYLMQID